MDSKESSINPRELKLYEAATVFVPSAPISTRDLFSGRIDQILNVINVIGVQGQHAIIYGERGVGKTSLASVIHAFLPNNGNVVTVKVNCDADMTFKSLFEAILAEIKLVFKKPGMGFNSEIIDEVKTLSEYIDRSSDINPNELRFLFRELKNKVIIIIDEFDRIKLPETRGLVADTIKNFSDYNVDTTFILVGVADSVEELISEHQSIERALVQVKMPRMKPDELAQIIDNGLERLSLKISAEAKNKIVGLSQGLPHYTHLLSLYAAQEAIRRDSPNIEDQDTKQAISKAIDKSQESVKMGYFRAINSPKNNLFKQVLLACALVEKNALGFFTAVDISEPLTKIMGKTYSIAGYARHLSAFCEVKRGPIIQQVGTSHNYQYRFINPLMEPFIIMDGLDKDMIKDTDLVQA